MNAPYVPLVPDHRLLEIIRGYVASNSTPEIRPDMNSEHHLMKLAQVLTDEALARIPLHELETRNMIARMKHEAAARMKPNFGWLLDEVG
jgi:hypothetical protein